MQGQEETAVEGYCSVNAAGGPQTSSPSYLRYSVGLFTVLLTVCVVMGFGLQSAVRYVESYVLDVSGKGLAQSAGALSESINRVLYEHALQSQTIAQATSLRRPDADTLEAYLRALKGILPDYMNVQIADGGGRIIAATATTPLGGDVRQQTWFQAFLNSGNMDLRGGDFFETTGRTMIFPTPIVGEEGQFLGAVVLQVGFQSIEFLLDGNKRSATLRPSSGRVEYQLLGHDGAVLYDSVDGGRLGKRTVGLSGAPINSLVKPTYREELHPQRSVPIVTGYAPVNRYGQVPGWQWTVLIRMDREAILTPFHRFVTTMVIWGGLVLVVLMAILLWIIGRLKRISEASSARPGSSPVLPLKEEGKRLPHQIRPSMGTPPVASQPEPATKAMPIDPPVASPTSIALDPAQWEDLRRWVRLAEVNRVSLFKNHRGEDKELWVSRRYEWIGLGEVARTEWSQWFSWSLRAKGFTRWEQLLVEGRTISGPVSAFPQAEMDALASCDIRTVLVVPLMAGGEWWGFVEFDHCFTDRIWSDAEMNGLKATAALLQTVIQQGTGEESLSCALAIMDAVLESTADGLLVVDEDGVLINFNQRLVSMWKMPDSVTESRLTEEMMGWMMRQLKVPNVLLRTMSELGGEPDAESYDILELQDGRLVERFSKPRRERDEYHGRIWIFRETIALKPPTLSVHLSQ